MIEPDARPVMTANLEATLGAPLTWNGRTAWRCPWCGKWSLIA